MSYAPTTDFLALLRQTSGGVRTERMPGLDYIVAALARAGLFTLSVGQTAPTTNQATTVWFQPSVPSWVAEGTTWLWNAGTGAYQVATPALWDQFLAPSTTTMAAKTILGNATGAAAGATALTGAQVEQMLLFTQSGAGALQRGVDAKLKDVVSVKDFGAVCDGAADDTAAIQAALNTGRTVILPDSATCKITSALQITVSGTGLIGAGWASSVLTSSAAGVNTPMISIAAGLNNITLRGFQLTRSVTAATNSDGIYFNGHTENSFISDILVQKQFNGLTLRTTSYSVIRNVQTGSNQNHGFQFIDTPTVGVLQWYMYGAISGQNGGIGFLVQTGNGTLQSTLGSWAGVYTFANSSYGIALIGTATAPIYDARMTDLFLGEDGNHELFLDTYGGSHVIGNAFFELAGTRTTGPGVLTPASNTGSGVKVTANNRDVRISNSLSDGNKLAGFDLAATEENNLSGSRGSRNGTYGLILADGLTGILTGNKLIGNTSGAYNIPSNGLSVVASGNSPQITPSVAAALGADVLLNVTASYFDGPSITLGAGTWLVTANVAVSDTAGAAGIFAKLWDGTTVIDASAVTVSAAGFVGNMALSGVITCANGAVVKVSCRDSSATTGKILFNQTGNAKDSTITAVRIG